MSFFFFNDTATTEIYTLSLHDALPIYDYCVDIPDDDLSYYFSKQAISLGYNISFPKTMMLNSINCYANRECHYMRSEEHTSELQSRQYLVCRLLLEKKKQLNNTTYSSI